MFGCLSIWILVITLEKNSIIFWRNVWVNVNIRNHRFFWLTIPWAMKSMSRNPCILSNLRMMKNGIFKSTLFPGCALTSDKVCRYFNFITVYSFLHSVEINAREKSNDQVLVWHTAWKRVAIFFFHSCPQAFAVFTTVLWFRVITGPFANHYSTTTRGITFRKFTPFRVTTMNSCKREKWITTK